MRLRDPRLWLSGVSLGFVLLLVLRDVREKSSPGSLAPAHASVSELSGPAGCERCHGTQELSLDQACTSCHDVIGTHLIEQRGLHGTFDSARQTACGTCHIEHHGADIPLVGVLAFERAGIESIEAFGHTHVAFELSGAHDALGCEACHQHVLADPMPAGALRYAGASQRCESCHEDPHEGRYREDCAGCHGQERPFVELAGFVHTDELPLVGAHAGPACGDCHAPESAHAIEALASPGERPPARTCEACHDSPHRENFLAQIAAQTLAGAPDSCGQCHDASHPGFGEGASLSSAQHAASGFAFEAPHVGLECASCHRDGFELEADFAERHPGRGADSCEACHADVHAGQFTGGAFAGASCSTCHERSAFQPHAFTAALHAASAFPLESGHAPVPCADCHEPPEEPSEVLRFGHVSTSCAGCHEDAHAGGIVGTAPSGCAECHRATRFDEVVRAEFDHDTRTRFALEGVHAASECESCHLPGAEPDALGRRLGRVLVDFAGEGPAAGCASCHEDVHGGAFHAEATADEGAEEGSGCASCHTTTSFRELRGGDFEHGRWTGFALEGAHDAIACQACHGAAAPEAARTLGFVSDHYGGPTAACGDCHEDVHAGAFDRPGHPARVEHEPSCARCHGTEAFDGGVRDDFEHGLWTGFELADAHAESSCDSCHVLPRPDLSLGAVRGARCSDCHSDPHVGQFAVSGVTDCAACHASARSFSRTSFDHQVQSRFALDEQHAELDCSACHRPWPVPGGGEALRYKPLGVQCTDCHASEGGGGQR